MRATARGIAALAALLLARGLPAQEQAPLRWGGDAEGGAPFVEADPADPTRVRGFDVEVAERIALGLGRKAEFVQVAWASIDSSVARGDFDIGLSGVEDAPGRRASHAVTVPYFAFREVLTVRAEDRERFRSLRDLAGRRVGTLAGTLAYEVLLRAAREHGVEPVSYDTDTHPYQDLRGGRLDAVLLDHIIAARATARTDGLVTQPGTVAVGHYVGVLAQANTALRDQIDAVLRAAMRDGSLEAIYRRWQVWDETQPRLFADVLSGVALAGGGGAAQDLSQATLAYLPALLRAAGLTLLLSCLAMAMAVALGVAIACGRVYGGAWLRVPLHAYVEVMRGTPALLQLFVLYYGLASVVALPAFVAAVLGLALNYAAYESEIYRGALESVPRGQLEAARVLGLREAQVLRWVRGPQAFRLALAPMTNDFVALLKDSSLVSVITVVELTKQTSIFATNVGNWLVPGVLCAVLYLAMSLPLAHLARRLELRLRGGHA
ncbi:MAG: ABC transporter permease subunit [Planctomycetes bacterium]|nr:ABC transporter permease subunit [Planctomycetota bacterium]